MRRKREAAAIEGKLLKLALGRRIDQIYEKRLFSGKEEILVLRIVCRLQIIVESLI